MTTTLAVAQRAHKLYPRCSVASLRRTVQRWCTRLGYKRVGRDWWLSDEQVAEVLRSIQPTRGNPEWRRQGE